jgi:hypothetical protein
MAWRQIGSATLTATSDRARIGYVKTPPQGGIEVWVRQTSGGPNFRLGYCLLYLENQWGRELGTVKVWPKLSGEAYRLGAGLSSMVGGGVLWLEPRSYNLRWLDSQGSVSVEVFADEAGDLPQDRYRSPGFVNPVDVGLFLVQVGSAGRLRF